MSVYNMILSELQVIFGGAPEWTSDYVLPVLAIASIIFLFGWIISLVFNFAKKIIRGWVYELKKWILG